MTITERAVSTMPTVETSGRSRSTRSVTASKVTYVARSQKLTPISRPARAPRSSSSPRKYQTATSAAETSTVESSPKLMRAPELAMAPAEIATTASSEFHTIVAHTSNRDRRRRACR